jgi:prevent-host-death family protein
MAASDVRDDWRNVLNRVEYDGDTIIVTRYGRPIARIVPAEPDQPGDPHADRPQ